jgi:PAS domain S-box-containing protein/putative nucleotidyltransferase with HDIG domain
MKKMKLLAHKLIIRIPLIYLLFAGIWITVSDRLVELISPNQHIASVIQTYKGWAFVVITALLLFLTLRREIEIHDRDESNIKHIQTALNESAIRFRTLFESSPIGISVTNGDKIIYANPEFAQMFGYLTVIDLEGILLSDRIEPKSRDEFLQQNYLVNGDLLKSVQFETQGIKKDGTNISLIVQSGLIQSGFNRDVVNFFIDSTHQKLTEQNYIFQIEKLNSLRNIDSAINSSHDLHLILDTILEQVTTNLKVDAASILLLQQDTQVLEYAAGCGFENEYFTHPRVRVGEDPAGRAALFRKTITIHDLRSDAAFSHMEEVNREGFISVYIVPLIAKGMVKGVMQVFHRSLLNPDSIWLDYLETLGGQAAIAIDSSSTYNDLQRSNTEIVRAYEDTIEGWSNALDLRDHETEGHTKRVTNLTLQLAQEMGLRQSDLVQIRRGALLHDIGKMGIPDSILLKEGPLTDEERSIMNNHPTYAYELLSPITYLRQAMEIPFCHHEKWDGSGYPRGLRHEMIPLEARIFSIIDVYDALRSDRPYRKGLSEETVLRYISDRSGTQFDPQIVQVFLDMVKNKNEVLKQNYY